MKRIIFSSLVIALLFLGTLGVIFYGRGYRFGLEQGTPKISGTGLFVATSKPNGAQVFINDHLTTATDTTIDLVPGVYQVRIVKQGYLPWQKQITVQKEAVTKEEALLIPVAPKLESITDTGVLNPVIDPTRTMLAYTVASASARENGVYVLDMSTRPILTIRASSRQIADDLTDVFSSSRLSWSPDGTEVLATVSGTLQSTYLLSANDMNDAPRNVSEQLFTVSSSWQEDKNKKDTAQLNALPTSLRKMVRENFNILEWSPDESKIFYTASTSAVLPVIINPRLVGTNSTTEERSIKQGNLYVYDIKEDRNYALPLQQANSKNEPNLITWFPDSRHFLYVHDKKIDILEFDGQNQTTVYAGPFIDNFVFPWPDGTKIVILTNLGNAGITPNLYTISLN